LTHVSRVAHEPCPIMVTSESGARDCRSMEPPIKKLPAGRANTACAYVLEEKQIAKKAAAKRRRGVWIQH
jgi:hypothetical protein